MSALAKVSVALSAELNDLVQQVVAAGEYSSHSDVIDEALQEWSLRRQLKVSDKPAFVSLWNDGLASGPGRFGSMDDIKAQAKRRLEAGRLKTGL